MSKLRSVRDAQLDARLAVRIVSRKALRYRGGADAALDRPAHVRAASALCWVGPVGGAGDEPAGELLVLQDDAAFLGVVDAERGLVEDVALPAGAGGARVFDARRGNKAEKPDFELAFGVPADGAPAAGEAGGKPTLFALGSGGLAARQRVLRWRRGEAPTLVALPRLYALLREAIVGDANLNFEGAALLGDQVVLANRGGDGGADGSPDALVRLPLATLLALLDDADGAALPTREQLQAVAVGLGELADAAGRGHRLRFTDLSPRADGGLWYLAAAEQTDNFYDDGDVVGSVLGVIELGDAVDAVPRALRFAPICDEHGQASGDKVEGVCAHARADRLWAVTDPDDPDRPGELLELELHGPW